MKFLNNLKQTISFKIMSVMGYALSLGWLITIFLMKNFNNYLFNLNEEMAKKTIANITLLENLMIFIFPIITLILLIIGILEYKKIREQNGFMGKNKDFKFYLFSIGLILTTCWPLTFIIFLLFILRFYSHTYTLL